VEEISSKCCKFFKRGKLVFKFLKVFACTVENNKIRGEIAHSIAHSKTRDHTSM